MKDKLSPAQQKVIDLLKKNKGSYLQERQYFDFQTVNTMGEKYPTFFKLSTLHALIKKGIIIEFELKKYKLKNYEC